MSWVYLWQVLICKGMSRGLVPFGGVALRLVCWPYIWWFGLADSVCAVAARQEADVRGGLGGVWAGLGQRGVGPPLPAGQPGPRQHAPEPGGTRSPGPAGLHHQVQTAAHLFVHLLTGS